jgi:hypothetical protein
VYIWPKKNGANKKYLIETSFSAYVKLSLHD